MNDRGKITCRICYCHHLSNQVSITCGCTSDAHVLNYCANVLSPAVIHKAELSSSSCATARDASLLPDQCKTSRPGCAFITLTAAHKHSRFGIVVGVNTVVVQNDRAVTLADESLNQRRGFLLLQRCDQQYGHCIFHLNCARCLCLL